MTTSTTINEIIYTVNGFVVINNNEERTSYIIENTEFKTINSLISYTERNLGQEVDKVNGAYYTELNEYARTLIHISDLEVFKKNMINKHYAYMKYRNQAFARMFGVSPKVLVRCLNGLIYKTYIEPISHLRPLWNYHQNMKMVRLYNVLDIAVKKTSCIKSFEQNVAAFGMLFENPQAAKKGLGKGLWKSVCSNSNNKNCLIISHAMEGIKNGVDIKTLIEGLHKLQSTWLNRFRNLNLTLPAVFVNRDRVSICWLLQLQKHGESLSKMFASERIEEVVRNYYLIKDTFDMACDVRGAFDPSWSVRKMKEMHDKYVQEQVVKESSPDRFVGLDASGVPEVIEEGDFKATLLSSFLDYAMERELQQHCIYTYANRAEKLDYFAYKIEGPNGFRSTLGFGPKDHTQHYKKYNDRVTEQDAVEFAAEITKKCSKALKMEFKPGIAPVYNPIQYQELDF